MPIGRRLNTSQNNHNVPSVSGPFLYLFSSKNAIFHKFLYRTFWYSRNYTYFYFPKWRYKPRMVLKITNLHILRYLPTCWLYLLECYTIDNQRCTHAASVSSWLSTILQYIANCLKATVLVAFFILTLSIWNLLQPVFKGKFGSNIVPIPKFCDQMAMGKWHIWHLMQKLQKW